MIESTQRLIGRLSKNLQPVRPLPRLRSGSVPVMLAALGTYPLAIILRRLRDS